MCYEQQEMFGMLMATILEVDVESRDLRPGLRAGMLSSNSSKGWQILARNCARLATNGTNLGLFKISFLFILVQQQIWDFLRSVFYSFSPRFVLFGANLATFEAKSDIPD